MNALVQASNPSRQVAAMQAAEHKQYLTFMLSGEVFAIGILAIKEIIEYGGVTDVPMMPPSVRGVINLRGAVVPVVDLSVRFDKPSREVTKRTCIVIVEIETGGELQVVGAIVDAVNAVVEIAPSEIEPPPAFGARIRTAFIEGMGKVDGKFVILLNADEVLSVGEAAAPANMEVNGLLPHAMAMEA